MRQGAELVRASQPFAKEQIGRTWFHFLSTSFVYWALIALTIYIPVWYGKLAASTLAGLTIVRLFIIYHDFQHGAIFRKSKLGKALMYWVGFLTLVVPSVWKETHDYHHRNNARLLGSAIGSYPLVTVGIWKGMKPKQRRLYKFTRHPITMLFGAFTVFMAGMCIAPWKRDPESHRLAPVALVVWWVVAAALIGFGSFELFFFVHLFPTFLTLAIGSYLFYAQHNFPDAKFKDRRQWDYHFAAMNSSSMFDMSLVMHWFTGNIGYHHIHHLNHRIPFYRLPEAMAALPETQNPGRTSWALKDIYGCLRLALWDPEQKKLVSHREADRIIAAQAVPAAK